MIDWNIEEFIFFIFHNNESCLNGSVQKHNNESTNLTYKLILEYSPFDYT